jgi:hypothetical protein
MTDADRGAALMFAWKVQREGYMYARENYSARYLDSPDLTALDAFTACRHANLVAGTWREANERLGSAEVTRLYELALAADRARYRGAEA